MPRPTVSAIAEKMYEGLLPAAFDDEAQNWALLHFCEAFIGSMQLVEDLIRDDQTIDAPGWSVILDVDRAPYYGLPWLGQFVGVTTPALMIGETEAAHDARVRDYIRAVGGFDRGKPSSVVGAVQQFLTGTKEVILYERDTSPYHFDIRSRESETPVEEWATTNHLDNGDFETDAVGVHGLTNATINRVGDRRKFGTYAVQVNQTAAGGFGVQIYKRNTNSIAALPGELWSGSAWVRSAVGGAPITVSVDFYSAALAYLGSTAGTPVSPWLGGDVFARVWVDGAVAPATTAWARLSIAGNPVGTGYIFDIDGVQLEKNAKATPFVPTSTVIASRAAGMGNVLKAINAQKPAGLQFTYQVIPGWTYDDLDAGYATYNAIDAAFTTYDDIDSNNP